MIALLFGTQCEAACLSECRIAGQQEVHRLGFGGHAHQTGADKPFDQGEKAFGLALSEAQRHGARRGILGAHG